jgi:hypothetical protein
VERLAVIGQSPNLFVTDGPAQLDLPLTLPGLMTPVRGAYMLADQARTPIPIARGWRGQGLVLPAAAPQPICSVVALDVDPVPEVMQ